MKLLIATSNPGKKREMINAFKDSTYEVLSLDDVQDVVPVEETGETFEENALLKAKGYFAQTGIPCIADDGGLMVDALGGPGAHSRRWLGEDATDEELAKEIVKRLKGVPQNERTARLGGLLIYWDGKKLLRYENYIEGYIVEKLTEPVEPGFPYRSILMIPKFGKLYSKLTEAEHNEVNFRRKSLAKLKEDLARDVS